MPAEFIEDEIDKVQQLRSDELEKLKTMTESPNMTVADQDETKKEEEDMGLPQALNLKLYKVLGNECQGSSEQIVEEEKDAANQSDDILGESELMSVMGS